MPLDPIDALIHQLQHPNRFVRREAVVALRQIGLPIIGLPIVEPLIALLPAPDPNVRAAAIHLLTELSDPRGVDALIALLAQRIQQKGWRAERLLIAQSLYRINQPRAQSVAFAFFADRLQHGTWSEREEALAYMIHFPSPEAETLIRAALKDRDEDVRKAAARCLADRQRGNNARPAAAGAAAHQREITHRSPPAVPRSASG